MYTAERGFTLVELIIVIAIIGLLAGMGLVSMQGARERARDATRMADVAQTRVALAIYFDDYGAFPPPVSGSNVGPDVSSTMDDGTIFSEIDNPLYPKYMSKKMIDPTNDDADGLVYHYDTNQSLSHRGYVLCFRREGGKLPRYFYYNTGIYGGGDTCPTLP